MSQKFDLVVIGGGPAGYVAAIKAAQYGKTVAMVEVERAGGTCLNWGCIPTKALLKQAEFAVHLQHAEDYGFKVEGVSFDFAKVVAKSRKAADKMAMGIDHLFKKNKITPFKGTGTILRPGLVEVSYVDGQPAEQLECENIVIATGARPRTLPGIVLDRKTVMTSREALALSECPKSILIIGAGAIGVEFAYFYNAFGAKVTLVEFAPNILPIEDEDSSKLLLRKFESYGIEVLTSTKVTGLDILENGAKATFEGKPPKGGDTFEKVLVAVGVEARLEGLLGPDIKLDLERGFVRTNSDYSTSLPGVFAIGDVNGPPWLAHEASWEAGQCIDGIYGGITPRKGHLVPGCTYAQPQVASVGATERKLKEQGIPYKVGKFPFIANGKAVGTGDTDGFVKLLYGEAHHELLGAHIVGSEATELIAELNLAMNLEATLEDVLATMHAHPTLSEVIADASAVAIGKAVHM
ncbi:MAG: dihydrolipoyl dehydrogenase [Fibrobacteria bacterium]|nr:dihydrolipoyl dehydrogenase [Fibrobacteria bacterium]